MIPITRIKLKVRLNNNLFERNVNRYFVPVLDEVKLEILSVVYYFFDYLRGSLVCLCNSLLKCFLNTRYVSDMKQKRSIISLPQCAFCK